MLLLLIGALILVAPFVLRTHYRKAAKRLRTAPQAWDAMEKHAHVLLEDRHLSPEVGDFVEFTLNKAGSGVMTRTFLKVLFFPWLCSADDPAAAAMLGSMNQDQEQQLFRFMVAAMLYDSLRTSITGSFLRRVLYWMAAAATDKTVPVSRAQVQPIVYATDRLCHAEAA